MSRQGRAIDILIDWRDHPRDCTAEHGWADGYDGWCGDDPFEVLKMIDVIDPFFRQKAGSGEVPQRALEAARKALDDHVDDFQGVVMALAGEPHDVADVIAKAVVAALNEKDEEG